MADVAWEWWSEIMKVTCWPPQSEAPPALAIRKWLKPWLLHLGLQFAAKLLFCRVVAESDALRVIDGLRNRSLSHSYLGFILFDCKMVEAQFLAIRYSHVGRNCNLVAHTLAKYALEHPSQTWIEEGPRMVCHCTIKGFCPII